MRLESQRSQQELGQGDRLRLATGDTFDTLVVGGGGPIVVEFMSYSCGHCQQLEPVIQEVAELLQSKVSFFRVNVTLSQELAGGFQIDGTPTLVMFLDGQEVGRVEGPHPTVSSLLTQVTRPFQV